MIYNKCWFCEEETSDLLGHERCRTAMHCSCFKDACGELVEDPDKFHCWCCNKELSNPVVSLYYYTHGEVLNNTNLSRKCFLKIVGEKLYIEFAGNDLKGMTVEQHARMGN